MSQFMHCIRMWWEHIGHASESDRSSVLQLCLRGLGVQAWRLQQETLWFGRAGESHPQCAHVFVALFCFSAWASLFLLSSHPHHWFFCWWPPLSLCLSHSLPTPMAWMDNRGGLMSHDMQGVVQGCALPVWITTVLHSKSFNSILFLLIKHSVLI